MIRTTYNQDRIDELKAYVYMPIILGHCVQAFGGLPLKPVFVMASAADAVLHRFAVSDMRIFQTAWKIEGLLSTIRVLNLIWSSGYLLRELAHRATVLPVFSAMPWRYGIYSWVATIGVILMAAKLVEKLNQWHLAHQEMETLGEMAKDYPVIENAFPELSMVWEKPNSQTLDQWIYVLQATVSIALVIFSKHRFTFILTTAFNLYTLYQMTQHNWVSISRKISVNGLNCRFTYKTVFMQDVKSLPTEECGSCGEEKKGKAFFFCERHSFHQRCLTSWLVAKTEEFKILARCTRVSHQRDGVEKVVTYKLSAPQSIKPFCPGCRKTPSQNELLIHVWDERAQKWCWGDVTWLNYQPDQEIDVKVTEFDVTNSIVWGELGDGSYVVFHEANRNLLQRNVRAKIISVQDTNGRLYLNCTPVPSVTS